MKYKCSICGYVYDDAQEGVPFASLPEDWQCPLCGAPKSAFEPVEEQVPPPAPAPAEAPKAPVRPVDEGARALSIGQMAALCSNLARGCEKQYMPEEQRLFSELAAWFTSHTPQVEDATVQEIAAQLQQDIASFPQLNQTCAAQADRGALRVLTWSEKATRMLSSLVSRYQKEGDALLSATEIWVCSVCGFVYIGKDAPELCPICKVPSWKFIHIERRKQS